MSKVFFALVLLLPLLTQSLPNSLPWMSLFKGAPLETVEDPKPCCFPETWEGIVETNVEEKSESGGKYRASMTKVFVDGANKRYAAKVFCPYSGKEGYDVIGVFNKSGIGFSFFMFSKMVPDACFHLHMPIRYKKTCIPDDATFKGTFNLGPAAGNFHTNAFQFSMKNRWVELAGDAVVTKECVPVAYREVGKIGCRKEMEDHHSKLFFKSAEDVNCGKGKSFVVNALYHDLYTHIHDESVFVIPDACKASRKMTLAELESDEEAKKAFESIEHVINYIMV